MAAFMYILIIFNNFDNMYENCKIKHFVSLKYFASLIKRMRRERYFTLKNMLLFCDNSATNEQRIIRFDNG